MVVLVTVVFATVVFVTVVLVTVVVEIVELTWVVGFVVILVCGVILNEEVSVAMAYYVDVNAICHEVVVSS